jgi:phosphoserine phosphatase
VAGAVETIRMLQDAGSQIYLVTAGIAQAIHPLADHLSIRRSNVHAVPLSFDEQGQYAGFDQRSMLSRNGGKELVVRSILARSKGLAAFVGDGASDLETKGVVALFIGYGGVVARPAVRDNADVYVSEPTLTAVLPYLLA